MNSKYKKFMKNSNKRGFSLRNKIILYGTRCQLLPVDDDTLKSESLMPWNNDSTLLIDKYDVRCSLIEIPSSTGNIDQIAEDLEEEIECDKERYLDLHKKLQWKETRKQIEECVVDETNMNSDSKITSNGIFSAVGFVYEDKTDTADEKEMEAVDSPSVSDVANSTDSNEDDIPYSCPAELQVPDDVVLPRTEKEAAAIERTAVFIANEGGQMEVLLRTKQAANPRLRFLDLEHPLRPFYRHMLARIRAAEFVPAIRRACHLTAAPAASSLAGPTEADNVDISSTAYYALITKYRSAQKAQEAQKDPLPGENVSTTTQSSASPQPEAASSHSHDDSPEEASAREHYRSYYYQYYRNQELAISEEECQGAAHTAAEAAMAGFREEQQRRRIARKAASDSLRKKCVLFRCVQLAQQHGPAFLARLRQTPLTGSASRLLDFLPTTQASSHSHLLFRRLQDQLQTREHDRLEVLKRPRWPGWRELLVAGAATTNKPGACSAGVAGTLAQLSWDDGPEVEVRLTEVVSQIRGLQQAESAARARAPSPGLQTTKTLLSDQPDTVKACRKRKAAAFVEGLKKKQRDSAKAITQSAVIDK